MSPHTHTPTAKVTKAELSLVYATCRLILFYISTKYHQNIPFTERTRNLFQTKQREISPKVRKPELSFLYTTRRFVLFYIFTKYHQNIPKGIHVTERTRSFTPTLMLTPTPTGSIPKTICPPPPHRPTHHFGRGGDINSFQIRQYYF